MWLDLFDLGQRWRKRDRLCPESDLCIGAKLCPYPHWPLLLCQYRWDQLCLPPSVPPT